MKHQRLVGQGRDRVLEHRGRLLDVATPLAITQAYERPLLGVRVRDRYKALQALRTYAHAHSAYPFGEVIHVADRRREMPADGLVAELRAFLTTSGFADASVAPVTPTVEDSFIARTEDVA